MTKFTYNEIKGGVCAATGFRAGGVYSGIRRNRTKKDLCLIMSDVPCSVAGVFTQNIVQGAPVVVCREHVKHGTASAIICNSGNANTCNKDGIMVANRMCGLVSEVCGLPPEEVLVASTGVIGQRLDITPIENSMDKLYSSLSRDGSADAAEAIMTTDTHPKEYAVEFELMGKVCRIGGIAKGVGMVCPNMATNLIFLTTDVSISSEMLQKALSSDVKSSFNMVSVDGDQSTNDTCLLLASGLAGNETICEDTNYFNLFCKALNVVTVKLSKMLASDGEGATKLVTCEVTGAFSVKQARTIARSVIKSSLVKAAMFGADANWGRVLCAMGYSDDRFEPSMVDVGFRSNKGYVAVCDGGCGVDFSEDKAKEILSEKEITICVNLNIGREKAEAWGCDLTYDYVKINGDYRT
ncbi:MAG: bifunctional glutamate N-acetyltransferase/amino-acid acetyltransferase ArgJ [Clostridia bacterium]|nr:bifunctional glutamate N-acetyltransferase/amino-acid acetyltransferase ArgJ [Clostridia bacterium]